VTLTGLGLKFSSIVISYAGGSLLLTAIYTSLIVWIIGLAVPVTASYIICAVIAAPALIKLGVPDYAAHMFIFYYAVLSEVSPPTALLAVCRGRHHRRRSLQDHAAVVEIHIAGVPGSVRVRAGPPGCRAATGYPQGWLVDRYRGDHDQDHVRAGRARRGRPKLGAATKYAGRARPASAIRFAAGVPSLIEAIIEWIIGRDISYTYVPGLIIGLGVLLWQAKTPAPKRPALTT